MEDKFVLVQSTKNDSRQHSQTQRGNKNPKQGHHTTHSWKPY